jgi:hypothetical protein
MKLQVKEATFSPVHPLHSPHVFTREFADRSRCVRGHQQRCVQDVWVTTLDFPALSRSPIYLHFFCSCGSAIASSSLATEWIKVCPVHQMQPCSPPPHFLSFVLQGKTIDQASALKNTDIAKHLNLPPVKLHCSMLAEDAIKAAINDFKGKQQP